MVYGLPFTVYRLLVYRLLFTVYWLLVYRLLFTVYRLLFYLEEVTTIVYFAEYDTIKFSF